MLRVPRTRSWLGHRKIAASQQKLHRSLKTGQDLRLQEQPSDDIAGTLPDPYHYTAGRWLHGDEQQRKARSRKFNFQLLCQKAVAMCPGATNVVRYEKREGGFNRVFLLHMDNGACIVARLPLRIAGVPGLKTQSEIATMTYLSSRTQIPIPKVLEWSSDENNLVGTEYIIMECAPGISLHQAWPEMNTHQHMLVTKAISKYLTEMARIEFPAYGSVYFDNATIAQDKKIGFAKGYVIGPHCGAEYWNFASKGRTWSAHESTNRGPWISLKDFTTGLLDAGHSQLPNDRQTVEDKLPYFGAVDEHVRLLGICKLVTDELIQSPLVKSVSKPMLLHPDVNKRNIYVSADDFTTVTSIIDWQFSSIEPAFIYANDTPDFVTPPPELSSIPEMNRELATKIDTSAESEKLEKDYWICRKAFEVTLRGYAPQLLAARTMDETLLRPFWYCYSSWRNSATSLRQELIDLSQRWQEVGLPGTCPYQPTVTELAEHTKQWEDFETVQKFKLFLIWTLEVDSDGWVPADAWQATKETHRELYNQWMETVRSSEEPEMTEERGRKLWPWHDDLRGGRSIPRSLY